MSDPIWAEKMHAAITKHAGQELANQIVFDFEELPDLSERAKRACEIMRRLDRLVPDEVIQQDIMYECSCRCVQPEVMGKLRDEFAEHGDLDRLLASMHGQMFLNPPRRDGNTVYITKAPRHAEEYANAATPEEKVLYFCHCDNVRASREEVSATYCHCGAGWAKHIFEQILDRPVRVSMTQSVLQGDEACVIAVDVG